MVNKYTEPLYGFFQQNRSLDNCHQQNNNLKDWSNNLLLLSKLENGIKFICCCLQIFCVMSIHCVVPEKNPSHPMEGHWKFLGGGGLKS